MRHPRLRQTSLLGLVLGLVAGTAACEFDDNPYGPAYRTLFPTIVGVYRPIERLRIPRSSRPDDIRPVPQGGDIRLVFGSAMSLTGRIYLPNGGPRGETINVRLYGSWEYDRTSRRMTIHIEPSPANQAITEVLQLTMLDDWIRLQGMAEIGGTLVPIDLGKTLTEPEGPSGGGPGIGNRVPTGSG